MLYFKFTLIWFSTIFKCFEIKSGLSPLQGFCFWVWTTVQIFSQDSELSYHSLEYWNSSLCYGVPGHVWLFEEFPCFCPASCFWTLKASFRTILRTSALTQLQVYMLWRHWTPWRDFFLSLLTKGTVKHIHNQYMHVGVTVCLPICPFIVFDTFHVSQIRKVLSTWLLAPTQPTQRKI